MARKRKAETAPGVDLPITPMLDMAFQLLTFFIFTYHPAAFVEAQMALNLPAAAAPKAQKPDDIQIDPNSDPDKEPKLQEAITVTIKTRQGDNNSAPSSYIVESPTGPSEPLNNTADLEKYLVKLKGRLSNQDDVKIQADSHLKYAYVMEVIDICNNPKKAGFRNVSFAPPPDMASDNADNP
jgi:biopolymer transport protein ExbD